MKRLAYVLATHKRIAPWDDPVGEVLIKGRPLHRHQREALAAAGFAVKTISERAEIDPADLPCLLLSDDLFFTPEVVSELVRRSGESGRSTQASIQETSTFARSLLPFHPREDGRILFPLYVLREPEPVAFDPVVMEIDDLTFPVSIPDHMRRGVEVAISLSTRPLVTISHAVDVLGANIGCLHARFARAFTSTPRKLLLALRARSVQPARLLAKMNRVGPGCDIHPTAYLEGAEIGAGVKIGAHAVVRMSYVGDGCELGDCAVVKHSVVGEGSVLFNDLTLGFGVCYPETFLIHGPYHLSVFGRQSAMFATILDDYRLDNRPIRLEVDGELRPHPFPFVGSFIGHRTRVAGGSIISPGRILPNDLMVFPPLNNVLTYIDDDLPTGEPLFIEEGRLKPLPARPKAAPEAVEAPTEPEDTAEPADTAEPDPTPVRTAAGRR